MTLTQLTPTQLTSVIQRDWRASIPSFLVAALVIAPAPFLPLPYNGVLVVVAVIAGIVTDAWLIRFRHSRRIIESRRPPEKLPDAVPFDVNARMSVLRPLFADQAVSSFVLFSFGTFVALRGRSDDPVTDAKKIVDQNGHVVAGTPNADTLTYLLPTGDFVVGGCHPSVFVFIPRGAFRDDVRDSLGNSRTANAAAMLGRDLRNLDAFALDVVYSETAS